MHHRQSSREEKEMKGGKSTKHDKVDVTTAFGSVHRAHVAAEMDAFTKKVNDEYEKDLIHLSSSVPRTTNFYRKKK